MARIYGGRDCQEDIAYLLYLSRPGMDRTGTMVSERPFSCSGSVSSTIESKNHKTVYPMATCCITDNGNVNA